MGYVPDLIGSMHGTFINVQQAKGPGYEGLATNALLIKSDTNNTLKLGDFSGNCISDFALCGNGLTVAFWLKVTAGADSDILYTAERDSDRGLTIYYLTSTSLLHATFYSTSKYGTVSVKLTPAIWYHVFVAWRNSNGNPWMLINGAEVFLGSVQDSSPARTQESHTHLLVGKRPTGGTSNFYFSQLVIWRKALERRDMQRVFHSVGLQACKFIFVYTKADKT